MRRQKGHAACLSSLQGGACERTEGGARTIPAPSKCRRPGSWPKSPLLQRSSCIIYVLCTFKNGQVWTACFDCKQAGATAANSDYGVTTTSRDCSRTAPRPAIHIWHHVQHYLVWLGCLIRAHAKKQLTCIDGVWISSSRRRRSRRRSRCRRSRFFR